MNAAVHSDWPLLARWHAAAQPDQFAGHFPGHPIVPGAYLLDDVVARIEAATGTRVEAVRDCKFLLAVTPGEPLQLRAAIAPREVRFALTLDTMSIVCAGTLRLEALDAPA